MGLMNPRPLPGGVLLYPSRIVIGIAILVIYVAVQQILALSLTESPLSYIAMMAACFCFYYSIDPDPNDESRINALSSTEREKLLKARNRGRHIFAFTCLSVLSIVIYIFLHSHGIV